jgi:hypothetical protein
VGETTSLGTIAAGNWIHGQRVKFPTSSKLSLPHLFVIGNQARLVDSTGRMAVIPTESREKYTKTAMGSMSFWMRTEIA